jgi:hypothetical protein
MIEEKNISTLNRLTGQVQINTVTVEKPVVGLLNTVF